MIRCYACNIAITDATRLRRSRVPFCDACSQAALIAESNPATTGAVPSGCSVTARDGSMMLTVTARSARNLALAIVVLVGINIYLPGLGLGILRGILSGLGVPLPSWLPGSALPNYGLIGSLFIALVFSVPLLIAGMMTRVLLFSAFGRYQIILTDETGTLFRGIGPFGRTQRINALAVTQVEHRVEVDDEGHKRERIAIHAERVILFGDMMTADRRRWLHKTLAQAVLPVRSDLSTPPV